MSLDFSAVTEARGTRATREQLAMIQTRYAAAARIADGRRVLEVACGPGRGLGLIARRARITVGADLTHALIHQARTHYLDRLPVLRCDAQTLPFLHGCFDVVVMFEAVYYLADPEKFIEECRRVLAPGGVLLLSTANREWPGFTGSALATRYPSAAELCAMLARHGFLPRAFGAFPASDTTAGLRDVVASYARRAALALRIVPTTLSGRELLKRVFYGPLCALGPEISEADAHTAPLMPIAADHAVTGYKVLFAIGQLSPSCQPVEP